jgi:predicted hydrocarbon binding protein
MKLLLLLSCLLLFVLTGLAIAQDDWWQQYKAEQRSPVLQEVGKRWGKSMIRLEWNGMGGHSTIQALLRDQDFRAELGVSNEQYEQIQETAKNMRDPQKNPELKIVYDEIHAIEVANGGRTLQNADEEALKRYFDLQDRVFEMTTTTGTDGLNMFTVANALEVTLTPEQKQMIKEVQLVASLSENTVFPPSMFESLGLSDAQKQEMEKIKKELDDEYEKIIDDIATRDRILMNWLEDECEKKGHKGINFDVLDADVRKQWEENSKKIRDEKESYGKPYAAQFKTKMFDILTDEQWLRLQNMVDNPSGLVKTMQNIPERWRKKMREEKEVWTPGPNSWQPGDPIPGGYREERNKRGNFPRPRN